MRLINYNLAQQSETVVTYSTQNVNFPASNIKHEFRSKMWRSSSNGNFDIDATNNKIDFKESGGGAELTATITTGTYTASTLATEIKTQLEAAGAETYTVTYSQVTGLWTISHAGSYLSLLVNTGTNTATNLLKVSLGFSNTDKTGAVTYTGSNIAIHTSEWLVFDTITTEDINSVVLLWSKENGIKLSESAVVKIQANATNVWSSPSVNETLTIDDDYSVASHFFTTVQSYRYWRVLIQDASNANLYVDLGVIVLGNSLDIEEPENGFEFLSEDKSQVQTTAFFNSYTDVYPTMSALSIEYGVLDYADATAIENAYKVNGNRIPVLCVLDQNGTTFNKNHFLLYGKMSKGLALKQKFYQYFETSLVIEETN